MNDTPRLAVDRGRDGEPLLAEHGYFSRHFYRTLAAAIRLAPPVTAHIVSLSTASGAAEDKVDVTREAPLPMSQQAFDDANEIYSLLVYWTTVFADQLHVQAPGPAAHAWRNRSGVIIGLPANISPDQGRYLVGVMATWLNIHLDQICHLTIDDVLDFREALKTVFQADARWPRKARQRYADLPCPSCKGRIAVWPPQEVGDDERIICESCGRWFEPKDYEFLIGVFKQQRQEQQRADRASRHLNRKYA